MKKTAVVISSLASSFLMASVLGQNQPHAVAQDDSQFLINQSKPYTYIVVDHVGPRSPLRAGESKTGLWLHLVNNCRLSIVVVGSRPSLEMQDKSRWVEDEVVPNRPSTGTESMTSGVGYRQGQDDLTDIFLSPNGSESEVRGAEEAVVAHGQSSRSSRPHGYNEGSLPGPSFLNVVPPGGEISFSLPSDHVSPVWHFEIPFRFALKHLDKFRQPYSYVALFWDDLSEADRSTISEVSPHNPIETNGSAAHEGGHASSSPH
jgi:hypothetical protein